MTSISEDALSGFRRITLENDRVRAEFLPELGGKMTSLVRLATCHEFLLQPQRALRRARYGDAFADYDTSGFDECVPTVQACVYPGSAQVLPDHGEVWSVPWRADIGRDHLRLAAEGRALPYRFAKTMHLESNELVVDYEIANDSESDLKFLWSAHPLLSVEPGTRIILPSDVKEMLVEYSFQDRLGARGSTCDWPMARTTRGYDRIDTLKPPSVGFADKLFTSRLTEGHCALFKPATNEAISFGFDPADVPYIGVWVCQGGWPDPARGHYTVALEPCTGRPDSLTDAAARGENDVAPARQTKRWTVRVSVHAGAPLGE
jgi:galactose mutarotase-like enzyme